jgi:hypothetical protein
MLLQLQVQPPLKLITTVMAAKLGMLVSACFVSAAFACPGLLPQHATPCGVCK